MAITDRYTLLSRVVRIANSAELSYFARLRALSRLLVRHLPATSVTIYLLDEDRRHLSRALSSFVSLRQSPCNIPLGEGVSGLCAAKRTALVADGTALHHEELRLGTETTFHAIPLLDCGVISFGLGPEVSPLLKDTQFVQDIVSPVEGLLQRIKLAESSARRVRNLTRLSELGQLLNRPHPPREMLSHVLEGCLHYSDACCVIMRLLEEKSLPSGVFKKIREKVRGQLPEILATEAKCSLQVISSGESHVAHDLIAEGEFPSSYVSVPLYFKTKLLGTLTFFGKKGSAGYCRNFDSEDRDVFENMAMLIANSLAEAANYEQLVLLSHENDIKVKELSLLYSISNVMLSTIQLNKLVLMTLATLVSGPQPFFERAMLFLINERAGIMQGMFGITREIAENMFSRLNVNDDVAGLRWNITEEELTRQQDTEFCRLVRSSRLELNRSLNICSRAVLEKRVILVRDPSREKRIDAQFVRDFDLSSFAIAPLKAKEQVIGVVIVDNPGMTRPIGDVDMHFLELFTNQAGMAIENSMLYNRLEDANRSLREARERLIHGARLATIGEMSATIAHELKGPLVSIGGFARRLEKQFSSDSTAFTYAATIVREVQRLEKMLTDILSYAKKTTICYTNCNIIDIIEDALAIAAPTLDNKNISVVRKFPRKEVIFLGDAQQLKQVFINLFLNSQEAMQEGGSLDISVSSTKLEGGQALSVKVADTGSGIPQEILNQIFTPFYTTKERGTGLGLPIANRIIINHGGRIQVTNREIGAEFNIILPLGV